MRASFRLAIVACLLLAAASDAAPGGGTERRCTAAVLGAGRRVLGRSHDLLTTCARKAPRRLARRIAKACGAGEVAAGGDCAGVKDAETLAACIADSHDADAAAIAAALGGAGESDDRGCRAEASRRTRAFA